MNTTYLWYLSRRSTTQIKHTRPVLHHSDIYLPESIWRLLQAASRQVCETFTRKCLRSAYKTAESVSSTSKSSYSREDPSGPTLQSLSLPSIPCKCTWPNKRCYSTSLPIPASKRSSFACSYASIPTCGKFSTQSCKFPWTGLL